MKSNKLADNYQVKAVEHFLKKQYNEALENYNQALRYAENDSQALSDGFAGRAEVYFETKNYQLCSLNIQKAIATCVDEPKCESLEKLQSKCVQILKEISSQKVEETSFQLSHPPHKKVPFIAQCLEVLENKVYGRYISTTKDLKPGDVVVLEEPFYKILNPEKRHTRCAICLKQNMLDLIPCSKCSKGRIFIQR